MVNPVARFTTYFLNFYLFMFRERGREEETEQGCQTHFHWGPHQPHGCLQRAEIILGLYKCNYSFEGSCEADVAPGENEFGTPALEETAKLFSKVARPTCIPTSSV